MNFENSFKGINSKGRRDLPVIENDKILKTCISCFLMDLMGLHRIWRGICDAYSVTNIGTIRLRIYIL